MVGYAALGKVVGADALGAVAAADLALARGGALVDLPLALLVVEARAQHLHRLGAVLVLRLLVLALHHDAGRQVRDASRRVGGVHVLAAGALRAVGVDAQVLVVDLDVHTRAPRARKRGGQGTSVS